MWGFVVEKPCGGGVERIREVDRFERAECDALAHAAVEAEHALGEIVDNDRT